MVGMTREQWLLHYVDALRATFAEAQFPLPEKVRVSMGFPCKQAIGPKRRIGECHHAGMKDSIQQVFISPSLGDIVDIGATLVHELCHVVTPGAQHKGKFISVIRAVGLSGKPTATIAGVSLKPKLVKISEELTKDYGVFPHSILEPAYAKKQGTRQLKLMCGCARIIRATRKTIEQAGIICQGCGEAFEEAD